MVVGALMRRDPLSSPSPHRRPACICVAACCCCATMLRLRAAAGVAVQRRKSCAQPWSARPGVGYACTVASSSIKVEHLRLGDLRDVHVQALDCSHVFELLRTGEEVTGELAPGDGIGAGPKAPGTVAGPAKQRSISGCRYSAVAGRKIGPSSCRIRFTGRPAPRSPSLGRSWGWSSIESAPSDRLRKLVGHPDTQVRAGLSWLHAVRPSSR